MRQGGAETSVSEFRACFGTMECLAKGSGDKDNPKETVAPVRLEVQEKIQADAERESESEKKEETSTGKEEAEVPMGLLPAPPLRMAQKRSKSESGCDNPAGEEIDV